MKHTTRMDFLAWLFYFKDRHEKGVIPPRWPLVRQDVRDRFMAVANAEYDKWLRGEIAAEKRRRSRKPSGAP